MNFFKKSLLFFYLGCAGTLASASENGSIHSANNQAYLNAFYQQENLFYHNNPDNYPLYNLHGQSQGVDMGISKTFNRFYTQLDLRASNGNLSYNNPSRNLSNATSFIQEISGRLGYSFFPSATTALTPYFSLGYSHWQLDTGGFPLGGFLANGTTQIFQMTPFGLGFIGQWSPTAAWVLATDLQWGSNYHPWVYATIPTDSGFSYVQANLARENCWQISLKSDYKTSDNVHALLGIQYRQQALGSGRSTSDLATTTVPAHVSHRLQYQAGLGYELDGAQDRWYDSQNNRSTLFAANNQAALLLGYYFQNYGEILEGKPGYLDRQAGHFPSLSLQFSKTWKMLYGQLRFTEALGNTRYMGSDVFTGEHLESTTRTTMTDLSGRLGYQFFPSDNLSLIPYGILGHHRWLRSIGYPETYQNNWAGLGALLQWAPLPAWVFTLDGNTGNTWNAQIHTWNTFYPPNTLLFRANLGSRTYVMAEAGVDFNFTAKWHLLGALHYWRFNYGKSTPNNLGDYEPTSNTRLVRAVVGLGYSW